jgi:RimJ/RimL family protein N-acetyltransferase
VNSASERRGVDPGKGMIHPITLEGEVVRLEPLTSDHSAVLCEVGLEEDLWQWTPYAVRSPEEMKSYIGQAIRARENGSALPFCVVEKGTGKAIGSTRYLNIDLPNKRLEIGSTWIGKRWQRTAVNTEMKYLLLKHAFEILGMNRVELKTDSMNEKSRKAILRIGAREEGTLRKHVVTHTGRIRDTVYYSIIDSEWLEVKLNLEEMLSGRKSRG